MYFMITIADGGKVMKYAKRATPFIVIFGLVFILSGCNNAPWIMRYDAKQASLAQEAALARGADKTEQAEYAKAMAILDKANSLVKEGNYPESIGVYKQAKFAFDKAAFLTMNESEKKAVIDETAKNITSMEEGWKKLESEAAQSSKKAAFDADSLTFSQGISAAKSLVATDTIGAAEKAAALKPVYDKWASTFMPLIPFKKS
jgi:hypothetical protein